MEKIITWKDAKYIKMKFYINLFHLATSQFI